MSHGGEPSSALTSGGRGARRRPGPAGSAYWRSRSLRSRTGDDPATAVCIGARPVTSEAYPRCRLCDCRSAWKRVVEDHCAVGVDGEHGERAAEVDHPDLDRLTIEP